METEQLKILCIDDSKDMLTIIVAILTKAGYLVYSAPTPALGLSIAKQLEPDLVLLDIMMPGTSGYDVCKALQQDPATSRIPVVFLSALTQPQNKVTALAAGGLDYLTKPFTKEGLLEIVRRYAVQKSLSGACQAPKAAAGPSSPIKSGFNFSDFKISVIDGFKPDAAGAKAVLALQPAEVYKLAVILAVTPARVARFIACFSGRKYFPVINPDDIKQGVLPLKFAVQNNIAAVAAGGDAALIILNHPFNFELHEMIRSLLGADFEFGITEPSNISALYKLNEEHGADSQRVPGAGGIVIEEAALNRLRTAVKSAKNEMNEPRIKYLTGKLLQVLAEEKPAEIRIEAQGACYLVKTGAPGAYEEFARFNRTTGNMVVARLKALGGMDILERSKPQAGAFGIVRSSELNRLALATEGNANGESLVLKPAV